MALALGLAAVVGFTTCLYFVLSLCYKYGAGNFGSWYFIAGGGAGGMAYNGVIRHFNDPWPTDWNKLSYFGVGMVAYSILAFLQYRLHWWPLHPVGIAVAPLWMTRLIAFSVFLAWVAKSAIMRYGGIAAYRQARPFFMGLIAGYFLGIGFVVFGGYFLVYGRGARLFSRVSGARLWRRRNAVGRSERNISLVQRTDSCGLLLLALIAATKYYM